MKLKIGDLIRHTVTKEIYEVVMSGSGLVGVIKNGDFNNTLLLPDEDPENFESYIENDDFAEEVRRLPLSEDEIRMEIYAMHFAETNKELSLSARVEEAIAVTKTTLKEIFRDNV